MYLSPFKYPGSKARALPAIAPHIRRLAWAGGALVVPFVGAGWEPMSVLEDREVAARTHLILADSSPYLARFWMALNERPDDVDTVFDQLASEWATVAPAKRRTAYVHMREAMSDSLGDDCHVTAAYLMIVQRLAFNGLFRTNRSGRLNVPPGSACAEDAPPVKWLDTRASLKGAVERLKRAASVKVLHGDWSDTLDFALDHYDDGYILCDPPYVKTHAAYTRAGFGMADQKALIERLAGLPPAWRASITNSVDADGLFDRAAWDVMCYAVRRSISCTSEARGAAGEIIAVKK